MQACDVETWERTKEVAEVCKVTVSVHSQIAFYDKHRTCLGCFPTVAEAYAFICGYESCLGFRPRNEGQA